MDYGNILGDSFGYAKDSVIGKWMQWLLLIIATILLAIPLLGYSLKVFRGEKPAPEVTGWGTLIIDGIKYAIIAIIWAIPCLIILFFGLSSLVAAIVTGQVDPAAMMAFATGAIVYFILFVIIAVITALLARIGIVRFARTGSMGEAFNFGEILATIGKIGWGSYILAWIVFIIAMVVIGIVLGIIGIICGMIFAPLILLVEIIVTAPITLFEARYFCLVYDAAGTA